MIGVVAEYNPFHKGHKYHLDRSREMTGDDTVAVVMSGDYVQRGEPAVYDKFRRAALALDGGADLVLELPLPWCISSAETFAYGAVRILEAVGVSCISFGSECGEIEMLQALSETCAENEEELKQFMKRHPEYSWPKARRELIGSELLDGPNNLLGLEYLKAARVPCITVKRYSVHDGEGSAMEIRAAMRKEHLGYDRDAFDLTAVSRLRMFDREYFNSLPDSEDGAGNRLYDAVRQGTTIDEICAAAKTKSITMSAIRRLTMSAVLGIGQGMNQGLPPYIRVLGFNSKGRAALADVKSNSEIPILTKAANIASFDEKAKKVFAAGASAHDLYVLFSEEKRRESAQKCGYDWKTGPIIV